jgi:cupin 2 domain-containing protein
MLKERFSVENIFSDLPSQAQPGEIIECLLQSGGFTIKRIISTGQSTPTDDWYDQEEDEWCILLKGSGALRFEGEPELTLLKPGDYLHIPAHKRHQVAWTSAGEPTVWLALHYHA